MSSSESTIFPLSVRGEWDPKRADNEDRFECGVGAGNSNSNDKGDLEKLILDAVSSVVV